MILHISWNHHFLKCPINFFQQRHVRSGMFISLAHAIVVSNESNKTTLNAHAQIVTLENFPTIFFTDYNQTLSLGIEIILILP